jgi:predicted transcriptional regulator of viral defense system
LKKENTLYHLREAAINAGKAVITTAEIANILGKPKRIGAVYAARMVKKGLAKRLMRGKFSLLDDDFAIASQLINPSYISLDSALLFHGIIQQVPRQIECVTTVNTIRLENYGIIYHKIPALLFYGYKRVERGSSYAFFAEPEKALIDGIYLGLYSNSTLTSVIKKVDAHKLLEYAKRYTGYGSGKLLKVIESSMQQG